MAIGLLLHYHFTAGDVYIMLIRRQHDATPRRADLDGRLERALLRDVISYELLRCFCQPIAFSSYWLAIRLRLTLLHSGVAGWHV